MKKRVVFAVMAMLAALIIVDQAFAQPPGGRGGRGGRGGGAMPQGDPNVPVVERGGFGPTEAEIVKFRDGIYLIRSQGSGNITVFTSDDGLLLVDTKLTNEYDTWMKLLRTVTDQPIKYVINTHFHPDHTGGNIGVESQGAEIIAQQHVRDRLSQTQQMGLPMITFDDHMNVYFAGKTLELYWYGRGHTDNDLVIYIPEEKIVMPGDLFAGWGPSIRLIDYNGGGSLVQWPDTLEKVMQLPFDVVIPGHSGVTDRAHMQAYLDENRKMLGTIKMLKDAGKSPQDITSEVTTEYGRMAFVVAGNVQDLLDELN